MTQHVAHRASDEIAQLHAEIKRLRAENERLRVALREIVHLSRFAAAENAIAAQALDAPA